MGCGSLALPTDGDIKCLTLEDNTTPQMYTWRCLGVPKDRSLSPRNLATLSPARPLDAHGGLTGAARGTWQSTRRWTRLAVSRGGRGGARCTSSAGISSPAATASLLANSMARARARRRSALLRAPRALRSQEGKVACGCPRTTRRDACGGDWRASFSMLHISHGPHILSIPQHSGIDRRPPLAAPSPAGAFIALHCSHSAHAGARGAWG